MTLEEINKLDKRTKAYKEAMEAYEKGLGESTTNTEQDTPLETSTKGTKLSGTELQEKHKAHYGKGLGDRVEDFTKATGIDKLVKWVAGQDCGCDQRKEKLNNLFSGKKPLCLTEEEYEFLDKLYTSRKSELGHTEQATLIKIEERIFQMKYVESIRCDQCIREIYKRLKEVYNVYR